MKTSRLKLKHQIWLIFFFAIVIFTAMVLYFFYSFSHLTQNRAANFGNQMIEQTRSKIDTVFNDIRVSTGIAVNSKLIQEYTVVDDDYKRAFDSGNYALDLMDYMRSFNSYVSGIVIDDVRGKQLYSLDSSGGDIFFLKRYDSFIRTYKKDPSLREKGQFTTTLKDDNTGSEQFFYIEPIVESIGGIHFSEITGYFTIMVNMDKLQGLVENTELTLHSTLYILDSQDEVIASTNPKARGMLFKDVLSMDKDNLLNGVKTTIDGEQILVQVKGLEQADGWRIVSMIPVHELTSDMNPMRKVSIIVGIGMILILIIMGIFFMNSLMKPVMGLVLDMKRVGGRDRGFRIKVRSTNEVGSLARDINRMMDEMEEMTRDMFNTQARLYKSELSQKQAEFSALQSQINPHFLYNTLNCISSIGLDYGSREIAQMTSSMSKIFRYSIKQDELVQIKEEVDCIQAYMKIISIRYEYKFDMNIDVEEGLLEMSTPKMILQPIVENAVYHGLERMDQGGRLEVAGRMDAQGDVCFCIRDTGKGIEPEELAALQAKLDKEYPERALDGQSSESIGLTNIHNRLRLLFGERYGITIESRIDYGTTVTVKIPALKQ
ncbi:sensor histidine kinase [Paenibacillus radicis (ex Gao et al. 2016)]|uniref:Sensor histidine kinase n=2 Tax=Paenibacillus radicis (ex Gao et al. 2016) TaxID=1737354 RepID=A0A917HBA0_9BACL|nr:histidine kinase [Paenibacillus radicis (ex Gao et al. 2016)]GGG73751.1 sensor histidine kinase [Paenibacillus radicis (ex Gao et al. 2016)]